MTREAITIAIDYLIDLLDALDGDPDLEAEVDHCVDDEGEAIWAAFLPQPVKCAPLRFASC